jgi:U6 snRNA-associated Sm-like protein LSm8
MSSADSFLSYAVDCSMVSLLDQQVVTVLRDGRHMIGQLISFDQYSNIVITKAKQLRVFNRSHYAEELIPGLSIVRGENIVMIGTTNRNKSANDYNPAQYTRVSMAELLQLEENQRRKLLSIAPNEHRDEEFPV